VPIVGIVFWKLARDDFKGSALAVRFMELVTKRPAYHLNFHLLSKSSSRRA
jgi:hypothetical protein